MGTKKSELADGCMAKASDNEPVFVLRAQDVTSPQVVREWARLAALNGCTPAKVEAALATATAMEQWPHRKQPD
jgi:hypothetical protein